MSSRRPGFADRFLWVMLIAALGACAAEPAPVHHPFAATIQSPCDNETTLHSASRDRLNHLRSCGAIDDDEWSCLGGQLDYLGEDVRRRCEIVRLSYANIAGEQRRRYATCIVPFDPGLVDCSLFITDVSCGDAVCDPERSLASVSAGPRTLGTGTPEMIAGGGNAVLTVQVHGYQGACDFRLDSQTERARFSALLEAATPGSVVAHEVPAEFYLRFIMKDGTSSELVLGERWLVPVGGSGREFLEGWRLPDLALRDYLRGRSAPCG